MPQLTVTMTTPTALAEGAGKEEELLPFFAGAGRRKSQSSCSVASLHSSLFSTLFLQHKGANGEIGSSNASSYECDGGKA